LSIRILPSVRNFHTVRKQWMKVANEGGRRVVDKAAEGEPAPSAGTPGAGTEERGRAVLATLRSALPSLQPGDARVAQLILDEPEAIVYRSVSEVAEAAATSSATVVRCAQRLGFRGFHHLKLALARELATFDATRPDVAAPADPRLAVLASVVAAGAQTVRDAAALVDPDAFDAAVSAIAEAGRVLFVGVGTSSPLTQDAAYRFSAIGVRGEAYADIHVQQLHARLLGPGDVCIAVSHTGSTRETLEAARAARRAGAATVAITSFARSPLTELVEHVIVAGTREVSFRLEAVASRLAHLVLLDALLVSVASRDEDRAQAALEAYADMLGDHRL
jgi:RpiR family transcriptional regulator, carbohydrate utilization regulator